MREKGGFEVIIKVCEASRDCCRHMAKYSESNDKGTCGINTFKLKLPIAMLP